MRRIGIPLTALICLLALAATSAQDKAGDEPYRTLEGWPALTNPYPRKGYVMGSQAAIFAESSNRIYIGARGELKLPDNLPPTFKGSWETAFPPGKAPRASRMPGETHNMLMIIDADGKLVDSWTQWDHLFEGGRGPHTIRMNPYDPERHVWVTNDTNHQIYEFSNDGKDLVRTLGRRDEAGEDATHFRQPTDIAWLPDGTFFVADGSGNNRVVKFDKNGNYLTSWGKKGTGPGEFDLLHMIAVGPNRRVYVADRSNSRIQVFDENGKFLSMWKQEMPQALMMNANGRLSVFSRGKFLEFDLDGKLLSSYAIPGGTAHQISADEKGNMYGAGEFAGKPFKFVPKAGIDPSKIVKAQPLAGKELITVPGTANYSGTWKLEKTEPNVKDVEGKFQPVASMLTITHVPGEIALSSGTFKQVFKLDGSEVVDQTYRDPDSDFPARTTSSWRNGNLVLITRQGFNLGRDTLSVNGNTLTISRDLSMIAGAYPVTITYRKQ